MKKEITQSGIPFDPNYFEDLSKKGVTKEIKDVFTFIFETNHWQGSDSVSGAGSDYAQTVAVAEALPSLLAAHSIKTMLDLPCGDFLWMSQLNLPLEQYIGADIVNSLITHHQQTYTSPARQFQVIDLTKDSLPEVDLIFCRDCLVHLSFDDIRKVFQNLVSSNIQYILTTTFTDRTENKDIITGDWRTLNLQTAPFNLPAPIAVINEQCTEGNGAYADKSMALWEVKVLTGML
ncbi:class I SAM-dependent methyltransferase [Rhodocytophaga rosea]|uniref:Class I SAM-dependent methyltransferase n=1 Tax=Rhodocytophaga rosea TaxID=2704465 RepID=A0A6C0GIK1_9BACT|nr:class I SAM-dependent methyltransferase [Rhodocytophaga rosea]QHT67881.1 class I SAM-dependent methyltransferase [Rhodocytophaga rosea]